MLRSRDDIVLQILRELAEIGAVARDAHQQSAVGIGILLCGNQRFAVDDVELEMPEPEITPSADEIDELFRARLAADTLRTQLDVEQSCSAVAVVVILRVEIREQGAISRMMYSASSGVISKGELPRSGRLRIASSR